MVKCPFSRLYNGPDIFGTILPICASPAPAMFDLNWTGSSVRNKNGFFPPLGGIDQLILVLN